MADTPKLPPEYLNRLKESKSAIRQAKALLNQARIGGVLPPGAEEKLNTADQKVRDIKTAFFQNEEI